MKRMKLYSGAFVSILLLAFLTSCGESTPSPAPTPTQIATPAQAPTPAPTPAPTAIPVPFPGLAEWDLLMISDVTNPQVGKYYAKLIETDLHVKVNVHDCMVVQSPTVYTELQMLQNNTESCEPGKKWGDLVREAEVIIVFGGPDESKPANGSWDGPDSWFGCVLGSISVNSLDPAAVGTFKASMVKSCSPATFSQYKTHLGALYDKIFELHAGNPVIVRATDFYIPSLSYWQRKGVEDCCSTCVEAFSSAIRQVAAEHKVLVGSSMTALNGQDRQTDPSKFDYIVTEGVFLSDLGSQRVAEALQQTGYAYSGK